MGLVLANHHLLLQEVKEKASEFALDNPAANKYTVALCPADCGFRPGSVVYALETLGKLKAEGTEYVVAEPSQVVAYVA